MHHDRNQATSQLPCQAKSLSRTLNTEYPCSVLPSIFLEQQPIFWCSPKGHTLFSSKSTSPVYFRWIIFEWVEHQVNLFLLSNCSVFSVSLLLVMRASYIIILCVSISHSRCVAPSWHSESGVILSTFYTYMATSSSIVHFVCKLTMLIITQLACTGSMNTELF